VSVALSGCICMISRIDGFMLSSRPSHHDVVLPKTESNRNVFLEPQISMVLQQEHKYFPLLSATTVDTSRETEIEKLPSETSSEELPFIIQQIVDERQEFNMHLGRAMETLRKDMQSILHTSPDYKIYHDDIEVKDPSGVQLVGIDKYRSSISFLQTFLRFWFDIPRSGIQYRMMHEYYSNSIRISWNIVLVPKAPWSLFGRQSVHVDGISIYRLDSKSGKILEHKFETLIINSSAAKPPYGIMSLLQEQDFKQRVPVGVGLPTF